ncbi:MAG TPA: polysaccharide biosynthesis C-terminal domain-containing protein [Flavisolibacter sp.]
MGLASGIKTNVVGMMLNTGMSVLGNILLVRYCLAANFGVLSFVTNNLALALVLLSLGIDAGVGFALVNRAMSKEKLLALICSMFPIFLLIVTAGLLILHYSIGFFNSTVFSLFCITYLTGNFLLAFFLPFYHSEGRYRRSNLMGLAFHSMVCLLSLVFLFADEEGSYLPLFALLYALLFLLYGIAVAAPLLPARFSALALPTMPQVQSLLKYSFTAFAANLLFLLVYRIDLWFIEFYCTDADLGNYIQASKLAHLFLLVPTYVATPIFFTVDEPGRTEGLSRLALLSRVLFVGNALLVLLALGLGSFLFERIYGESFDKLFPSFLGLSAGILALSVNRIICAFWAREGQVRWNVIGNGITLIVIIALDAIYIKDYGIEGAAVISSIGYTLFLLFNLYLMKTRYGANLSTFFLPHRSDFAAFNKHFFQRS